MFSITHQVTTLLYNLSHFILNPILSSIVSEQDAKRASAKYAGMEEDTYGISSRETKGFRQLT